jgi:hypothetical protein
MPFHANLATDDSLLVEEQTLSALTARSSAARKLDRLSRASKGSIAGRAVERLRIENHSAANGLAGNTDSRPGRARETTPNCCGV